MCRSPAGFPRSGPGWPLPLRIATPALIAAGALRVAWGYTYRVERRSALLFTLIYGMIDSLCTMAIYGGLLFDAFYPHEGGL